MGFDVLRRAQSHKNYIYLTIHVHTSTHTKQRRYHASGKSAQ